MKTPLLVVALLSPLAASAAPFQKVMVIVFENASFEDAANQPFFKELAARGLLLTNYHAITHPSQPNYVAMVAGTTEGVPGDDHADLDFRHIGDLLEERGKSWKVYAEGYPGGCFRHMETGRYVRRHVPFISFKDVQADPRRCAKVVDAAAFDADVAAGALPDYSFYVPDLDHDGHETSVEFADRWFEGKFRPLLGNPPFSRGLLLIVTFDEGSFLGDNRIYTAAVGDGIQPGTVSDAPFTHYSLLRSIEDNFGLGTLGREDAKARSFAALWMRPGAPAPATPVLRHSFQAVIAPSSFPE